MPLGLARLLRPAVPVWVELEPHVHMRLDPSDYLDHTILVTGAWEPDTWNGLSQSIPKGGVFVDLGAHVGYYSLKAAAMVGPSGRVLAVEPNPETLRKLRANIRESGAAQVVVEPVACSDSEGVVDFFASPRENTSASSMSKVNAAQGNSVSATYRVRTRRLDDIVRESGVTRVDVIKIDVEGAELLVLKGAGETLDRYHPVVEVELIDEQLASMGASSAQVIAFLRSHGYAVRHVYGEFHNTEFAFAPGVTGVAK
ncbi:MAG: FkbM family methyltransferase [Bryobacteraceae bacterium]|jgi:FkbM family methyltransferase